MNGLITMDDDKALSDTIYQELLNGLKTGDLVWTHFIAKHGTSKGSLYDAIGRFFRDMEAEARTLNDAQTRAGEAEVRLRSLRQRIEGADKTIKDKSRDIARLERKQGTLKKKAEALEVKVVDKDEIIQGLRELEKLGFGKDRLYALHATITEIANKRGLKSGEAADAFFGDLKDYDAMIGSEQELRRLSAATETARTEAEKWSAEVEAYEAKHKELERTIRAIQSFSKQGVGPEQIVSWNNLLVQAGGVADLEKCLSRYKTIEAVMAAKKEEQQRLQVELRKANAAVKTLTEQQAEIEASIRALSVSGVQEIQKVGQANIEGIQIVAQAGSDSIEQVGMTWAGQLKEARTLIEEVAASSIGSISQTGETALGQLKEAMSLIDQVCARALTAGQTVNQAAEKLARSRKITAETEALLARVEGNG